MIGIAPYNPGCTSEGFWHCITCVADHADSDNACLHVANHPGHRIAWRCEVHGLEEIPEYCPETSEAARFEVRYSPADGRARRVPAGPLEDRS